MNAKKYSERLPDHMSGSTWQDLCKSDYAKVIFCDLYHNADCSVGCRFQITDNVHEDPCDYIGLFKVGYDSLSQCLTSKLLSQTECEEDGKLLRCSFKTEELPDIDDGFYQFLYVTRDNEVCGASMPFEIKQTYAKDSSSDEDVVANEKTEEDFLLVRSNLREKNKHLQSVIDKLRSEKIRLEGETIKTVKILENDIRKLSEDKINLQRELKVLAEEKAKILSKCEREMEKKVSAVEASEKKIQSFEKYTDALIEKLKLYSEELTESEKSKQEIEKEKDDIVAANVALKEDITKLKENIEIKQKMLEQKDSQIVRQTSELSERSLFLSQLEDAHLMVKALEESKLLVMNEIAQLTETLNDLKEKLKEARCENFALKLKLSDSEVMCEKLKENLKETKCENFALKHQLCDSESANEQNMKRALNLQSEVTALKLHFADSECSQNVINTFALKPCIKKRESRKKNVLKHQIKELHSEMREKDKVISNLSRELCKKDEILNTLSERERETYKTNLSLNDAVKDALSRLAEAAEIYKKQYIEIEKLKRKLKKKKSHSPSKFMTHLLLEKNEANLSKAQSVKDITSCSSSVEFKGETAAEVQLTQNQNSDSDTGEHVIGNVAGRKENTSKSLISQAISQTSENVECASSSEACFGKKTLCNLCMISQAISQSSENVETDSSSDACYDKKFQGADSDAILSDSSTSSYHFIEVFPSTKNSDELQTLTGQNIYPVLSLTASNPEANTLFHIPCPICEDQEDLLILSADEMMNHLEKQHKQQMCPVCSRLFDMTLPNKYFQFHVEDHFNNTNADNI